MDVKRYDYGGGMMEFDTGPYVRFDDYEALRAECDRLRAWVAVLEARPENAQIAGLEYKAAQLRAERDALARRMRVVDMRVVACWRSDNTYWLDYPSGRIAPVICALNDDARANGYWPTAGQALDAAATALEAAGLMAKETRDA